MLRPRRCWTTTTNRLLLWMKITFIVCGNLSSGSSRGCCVTWFFCSRFDSIQLTRASALVTAAGRPEETLKFGMLSLIGLKLWYGELWLSAAAAITHQQTNHLCVRVLQICDVCGMETDSNKNVCDTWEIWTRILYCFERDSKLIAVGSERENKIPQEFLSINQS